MVDVTVILFGFIIGSFLTVCIYRIPLGRPTGVNDVLEEGSDEDEELIDESLPNSPHFQEKVTIAYPPRSFCPSCGHQLKAIHNIPVFSYLCLLGKCGFCQTRISAKYPLIEILTGAAAWLSYSTFDPLTALVAFIFSCSLIVISFIDLEYFIIPNVITYPGTVIGLLFGIQQTYLGKVQSPPFSSGIEQSLLGILSGAGVLLAISLFYTYVRKKQGLGLGDVKLLAVTGAFFGVEGALFTIFAGSLLGSVLGISLLLLGRGKWSSYIPFGPYLAAANLFFLFGAQEFLIGLSQYSSPPGLG